MATETDLTGLGLSPFLAAKLGFQPSTVTGVGTTQTGASTLLSKNVTLQSATGATAFIINPNADIASTFYVFNPGTIASAASALVYVPVGHTVFNAGATTVNGAFTVTNKSGGVIFAPSLRYWIYTPSQ